MKYSFLFALLWLYPSIYIDAVFFPFPSSLSALRGEPLVNCNVKGSCGRGHADDPPTSDSSVSSSSDAFRTLGANTAINEHRNVTGSDTASCLGFWSDSTSGSGCQAMGGFSCYKHEVFTITRNATTAAAVDQSNDTDSAQPNTIDGKACPFVDGDHRKIPCVCNVSATIDSENGRLSLLPDAVKMSVTEGSDGNAGAGAGTGADVRHVDIHVNHIHEYDGSGRIVRSFDTSSRSHNASWVVSGVVHTRYQGASCTQTTATLIVPLHNQNAEYTSLDTTDNNNPDPVDDIAANPFSLRLEIYTFKEVGLLKAGEEASLVFPGSVKINIQLLHWNFGLAATRLDINMIISTQTSSPLFSPPPSLPSLLLNSSAAEYTMSGFGLVTFSAVAECDGVWKSIPAPVYSRNTTVWRTNDGTANNSSETVTYFNHNQHYILTFPVFENSLYYDPIVHLAFVNAALSTGMYSEAIRELRDANTTKENDDSNSDTATLKLIFLMCAAFLFFIVGSISCYTIYDSQQKIFRLSQDGRLARSEIAHPGDEWSDDLSVTSARHSVVMEKGETTSKNINKKMDILNSTTNGEHSNVEADVCANDSQCCCQCQWWTDFCLSFRAGVGKGDGKSVSLSPVPGSGSLDQMTIGVKQQEYAPVIVTVVRESNSGSNKFSSDLHRSGSIVSDDTTTHIHDSKHNHNHNSATVSPKSPLTRPMGHDHSRAVFPVVHDNITLHGLQTSPEMRVRSSADNVKTDAPAYNINDPHEGPLSNMTETSRHLGLSYDSYSGTSDNNARDVDTNGSFNNGNGNSFGLHGTGSVVSVGSASIPERASLDGSEGGIKRAVHDLDNRSVYRQPSDHQQGVISSIFEQYTQPSVSYSNVNNIATSNINTSYEYHRQFISPFPSQLPSPRFKKSTARPPQPLELSQLSQSPPESQSPLFSLPDQNQDQESPATCYVDDPLSPFDEGGEAIIIISNTPKPKLSESINKLPPLTSFDEVYDGGEKDKKKSAFNKSYNSLSASDSSREKVRRGMKKTSLLQQISENKQNLSGNISHIAKHQYFNQRSSYTKSRSYGDHHHHSSSTSHGNGVGFHSRSGYRFNNSSGRVNNTKHGLQHGYGNRGLSRSHGRAAMNQNSQRSPPIACHASISRSSSLSSASVVERGQVGRKPKQHQFQQDQSTMLKGETNVIRVINGKMKVTMAEADDINHNQEEQSGDSVAKPIKSPTVEEKEGQIIHETMINDSAGVAHDNNNSSTSNNREPDLYRGGSSARNHMRDIKHGKLDSINSTGSVGSSGSSGIRHPYHTHPRGMKRTSNLKPVRGGNSANSITMKSVASMSNVKNMNKVQHSGRAQAAFETRRISSSGTRHDDTQTASETRALGSGNEKTDKVSSSSRGMTRTVRLDSALPFLVDTALHASNRRNSSQGSAPQHRHTSRALVNSHGGANRSSKGNPRRPRGMTRTVKLSDQSRTFRHENLHRGFSNISNNGSRNDGIRSSPSSVSANPF